MINGEIIKAAGEVYQVKLENGQSFDLERNYLPPALRAPGKTFQLLFSNGNEAVVSQEDARALLNDLLGA
ncbi:MAG: hypothetical protein A3H70_05760 [Candidatus Komeilibacteria bacterium RIFCSPLOWO2_02_FULL_48_11]|uniref:DUF3006 domain-containing protein n=1 Tax=Candidatus Komeilibacteria bacterium RIFCSPLOWO2_02_FULL_48_11 TaxID=1798553 RepID=A0A1G2BVF4_9BACT|nr:MAG: hypothetical protein A3H70_05760 [Candidatus Komeilibacteria bacterium RIFCSPLOWO2_02_FULL_48_11]